MYYYVYHQDLRKAKYSKLLINLEVKLQKLGLTGKTIKLGSYSSLDERLGEIKFTPKDTLVVVGDDNFFLKNVNLTGGRKTKPLYSYVPIGPTTDLTKNLGVPVGEDSVLVLANRRLENLDLGKINNEYFLDSVSIQQPAVELEINKKYKTLIPETITEIKILNLDDQQTTTRQGWRSNPKDGLFEIRLLENTKSLLGGQTQKINSLFHFKKLTISPVNGAVDLLVDNSRVKKAPQHVEVIEKGIKIIVGKNRLIND